MNFTLKQFNEQFPGDDACLKHMFKSRYGTLAACPKCGVAAPRYYRVRSKKVYECKDCGHQVSPLADTIFHKSDTPLSSWFYAIFMFSVSKNGVSAMELQRTLGVTYKCAWRMARQIRSLMEQDNTFLGGNRPVEVDETYIGGKHTRRIGRSKKQVVFGMVERDGIARVRRVKSSGVRVLLPEIARGIAPGTHIHSDEWIAYKTLDKRGYSHTTVNHSKLEYARGIAHTNTVEGFWSQLKRSIDGTYHAVSPKYLQSYLDEFVFRYNLRSQPVFSALVVAAVLRV